MRTRSLAALIAVLLAGCSSGSSTPKAGLLTSADLGPGWTAQPIVAPTTLQNGCESPAFQRFPPDTAQRRTWTRTTPRGPGGLRAVTEYLLGYSSSDATLDALSTYRDFVPQCTAKHEKSVTLPSLQAATTVRRGGHGRPDVWRVFAIAGDHATWLVITGGTADDVDALAESAVRRLG